MNYLDIELKAIDENGNIRNIKLKEFSEKNIILYFYPQDDTPVCTQEANEFKQALEKLSKYAKIIGVSANDIEDHKEFKEKYQLNFMLISDKNNLLKKAIIKDFKPIQNIKRSTFIINKKGKIIHFWEKVDTETHIDEIFEYLNNNKI